MIIKSFFLTIVTLFILNNIISALEVLKIGAKVKAGYSKEKMDCEVIAIYGNLVTLKSIDQGKQKIFHIFSENIDEKYFTVDSKIPKEDEKIHDSLFVDMMVEASHPNGEWYVGKIVEKYGKFIKVKMGLVEWAPIWVGENQFCHSLKVEKEIKFLDYRQRQIGILDKDGTLKNRKNEVIGRVYSNGKVFNGEGEMVGTINQDGSVLTTNGITYKTNIQFNNGLEYRDNENRPIFEIRIKSRSIYQPNRPDIVNAFFEQDQLKGNMRVCAGLFLLFKNKF